MCGGARIWTRSLGLQSLNPPSSSRGQGCSKTTITGHRTILQPTTDINSRGGCDKASDSYSLGLTQQLSDFYTTHKKIQLKTQKLSRLGEKTTQRVQEAVSDNLRDSRWGDNWHTEGKKMKNWKCRLKIIQHINEEDRNESSRRKNWLLLNHLLFFKAGERLTLKVGF